MDNSWAAALCVSGQGSLDALVVRGDEVPTPQVAAQLIVDTQPAPADSPLADRIGPV